MESERRIDAGGEAYSAEDIEVLKGLEAVRRRPGMYVGDTGDGSGLHNMVYGVVDHAINEGLAGYADLVLVALNAGGSVTIEDNGRGLPTEIHALMGVSTAEVIMTQLLAGARIDPDFYKCGLQGVDLAVVNALSTRLELTIWRGEEHFMAFADGEPEAPLKAVKSVAGKTGTRVTFTPSPAIFSMVEFNYATIEHRLRELASLNAGVTIVLSDLRGAETVRTEFKI